VDGLTIEEKLEGVHPVLFRFVFAVSTLGVLMAISFLVFNVYNQNIRYQKHSVSLEMPIPIVERYNFNVFFKLSLL